MPLSSPVTASVLESASGRYGRVAVAAMQGWRSNFEDAHAFDVDAGLFGVYDGHQGDEAAAFCAERLHLHVGAVAASGPPSQDDLQRGFLRCDAEMRQNLPETQSGSTATLAIVREDARAKGAFHITVGVCGDSRALLYRKADGTIQATRDHRPGDPLEKQRIEAAGGTVDERGTARIDGDLACSRALGAFKYKAQPDTAPGAQKVSAVPDVYEWKAESGDTLIIACDGVWDTLSNDLVVEQICHADLTSDIAQLVINTVQHCMDKDSEDNISLMVVQLGAVDSSSERTVKMSAGKFLQTKDQAVLEQYTAFCLRFGYHIAREAPKPPPTQADGRRRFFRSVATFTKADAPVPGPRFAALPAPTGGSTRQPESVSCDSVKDEEGILALLDGVPGSRAGAREDEDQPWWFNLVPCCFRRK